MDIRRKLTVLADAAKYDASCASSGSRRKASAQGLGNTEGMGICHSYTPDGRCVSLLKILLTNHCIFDCQYCVNRASSDTPRAAFRPDEVVQLTLDFYRRNYIEGLFLSSGIASSADQTMENLIEVARSLREDHGFGGYIHLKAVPGAAAELLTRAGRYADRLSANIELPTEADLKLLAPEKQIADITTAMSVIRAGVDEAKQERSRLAPAFAPAGQSTQLIVGATDTGDDRILATATYLYKKYGLRRVYYSAYSPIPHADARLPPQAPPLWREHRLYQADWLVRHYGFAAVELVDGENRNLDLAIDPKLAWALRHREFFPLDVNRAAREALLRIPGAGVRSVERILKARTQRRLSLADLRRLGVVLRRAAPFVLALDHNPDALRLDRLDLRAELRSASAALTADPREARQLSLFEASGSARSGEL